MSLRSILASVLVLAFGVSVAASPAPGGVVTGKVLDGDGVTPRPGVVVALVDPDTSTEFRSEPTDAAGAFRVEAAATGSYRLVAETSAGAYLAPAPMLVEEGDNRPVSLTLGGAAPNFQAGATTQGGSTMPRWGKWVIAGGIAVAALFVIDEVTSDEDQASGF